MKPGKIIVKPLAGLANRMRVIDSAISLARQLDRPLEVIWNRERSLNCHYNGLFEPIEEFSVSSSWYDGIRSKIRPWESLSFMARENISLKVNFAQMLWFFDTHPSFLKDLDFQNYKAKKLIFISTAHRFSEPANIPLFRPIPVILERINQVTDGFNDKTYGIHIRRTDSRLSISGSPEFLFADKINEMIQQDNTAVFFLATDDLMIKEHFLHKFPGRIKTNFHKLGRNDTASIQNALVDLYCLSRTVKIFGSFYSSFSATASLISGAPLEILKIGL
jgi:hypothetical protein